MADMGKGGEQELSSYMHCGTTMLVVHSATQATQNTDHHLTASAVCPMSCTQLLTANSRRRQ